jgi:hypothetical protein
MKVYRHIVLLLVMVFQLFTAPAQAGWFYTITPPNGGPSFLVGPYPNDFQCADMLGSAIFSHPWACHLGKGPTSITCRNTGNGFIYPADFPFPVVLPYPSIYDPGVNCFEMPNKKGVGQKKGWYFLFYTATGGTVEKCSNLARLQELARTVPGAEIPAYADMRCPGAPCFSVGFDTACN